MKKHWKNGWKQTHPFFSSLHRNLCKLNACVLSAKFCPCIISHASELVLTCFYNHKLLLYKSSIKRTVRIIYRTSSENSSVCKGWVWFRCLFKICRIKTKSARTRGFFWLERGTFRIKQGILLYKRCTIMEVISKQLKLK